MLTKYEEEEVVVKKQNDGMMHKGGIVTTSTFFTGEFSSVVMGEPVEVHVDDTGVTLNPNVWHRYVRQINDTIEEINAIPTEERNVRIMTTQPRVIVPRPFELDTDIAYDRPLAEIVSEEVTTLRIDEEDEELERHHLYEQIANLQRLGYNASEIVQMIDL